MKIRQLVVAALLLGTPVVLPRAAAAQESTAKAREGRALSDLSIYPSSKGGTPGFAPLPKGTVVKIVDERDGRYRLAQGGWVRVAGIEVVASEPAPEKEEKKAEPKPAKPAAGAIGAEGRAVADLSIYPTPVGGMPGFAPLKKGATFKILDEKGGRYRISTGGWVSAKGVELVTAEPSPGISDAVANADKPAAKPADAVGHQGRALADLSIYPSSKGGTPGFAPLPKGSKFEILEEKNGRYRISTGGWVNVKGVEVKN